MEKSDENPPQRTSDAFPTRLGRKLIVILCDLFLYDFLEAINRAERNKDTWTM